MEAPLQEAIPAPPAPAAAPSLPPGRGAPSAPAIRRTAYALVLAATSAWILFTNLGGQRLEGDEANYALCTDHVRASGEWLTLSPHPPVPYFEKPPLYMWLTALTYDRVPGFEAKYRFWSALFGLACVALTGLLGGLLLSPEAGLLAGLLLLTNRQFLLEHGARQGDMDVGLALLMVVVLLCFSRIESDPPRTLSANPKEPDAAPRRWGAWLGAGLAAGVACWLKPLAGVPILALPAAHAFLTVSPRRRRALVPPLLAAAALLATVASPWYVVQWSRFGAAFTHEIFGMNLVRRVTIGIDPRHTQGRWYFYLSEISSSSPPFVLFVPALLFAAARAFGAAGGRGAAARERRAMGLLAVVGLTWLVLFSLSRSKFLHYAYPVFPVLALSLAAGFAALVRGLEARFAIASSTRNTNGAPSAPAARPVAVAAWAAALFLLAVVCCRFGFSLMRRPGEKYVPWEIYRTFEPAVADGSARLIFCGVPATTSEWRPEGAVLPSDMIYLSHMSRITPAATASDLERLLADRRPAVVLLSKDLDLAPAYDRLGLADRFDDRFVYEYRAFTTAAVDTAPLMRVHVGAGTSSPRLLILPDRPKHPPTSPTSSTSSTPPPGAPAPPGEALPAPFAGGFEVRVTPPLPEDCLLTVTLGRSPETGVAVFRPYIIVDGVGLPDPYFVPFFEGQRVGVYIPRDPQRPRAPRRVRVELEGRGEGPAPRVVTGRVTAAELAVQPSVPVEDPWRLR